jgi:hypothetical protein
MVALPGYHTDELMPEVALWRLVTTLLGVAVNVTLAALLFPVTARDVYRSHLVAALEGLGGVMAVTCDIMLPPQARASGDADRARRVASGLGGRAGGRLARDATAFRPHSDAGEVQGSERQPGDDNFKGTNTADGVEAGDGDGVGPAADADAEPLLHAGGQTVHPSADSEPSSVSTPATGSEGTGSASIAANPLVASFTKLADGGVHDEELRPGAARTQSAATAAAGDERSGVPKPSAGSDKRGRWRAAMGLRRARRGDPDERITAELVARQKSHPKSKYLELGGAALSFKVLGGQYMDIVPQGKLIAGHIAAMAALDQALHYEYYAFSRVKR